MSHRRAVFLPPLRSGDRGAIKWYMGLAGGRLRGAPAAGELRAIIEYVITVEDRNRQAGRRPS
ncbi:MAG: hypothetical protein OXJ90_13570 [Spirochaetaceae bacterium]|nr:hypothetical protein [Spirochaetaceae bacterium]